MLFEYFSDFLSAVSGVEVTTQVKEEDVLEEEPKRRDAPGVLIYNSNILSLPYSKECPNVPEYKDIDGEDERALRILKIIEIVTSTSLISHIELPTLTGAIGSDYGGGDSVGINGNYYERMIAEKLAECLLKRSNFSLEFEIMIMGGRIFQTCKFIKDSDTDVRVYHLDQSNCLDPYEFIYGPFHGLDYDEIQYSISAGKAGHHIEFGDGEREALDSDLASVNDTHKYGRADDGHEREVVVQDQRDDGIADRIKKRRREEKYDITVDPKRRRSSYNSALHAAILPSLSQHGANNGIGSSPKKKKQVPKKKKLKY